MRAGAAVRVLHDVVDVVLHVVPDVLRDVYEKLPRIGGTAALCPRSPRPMHGRGRRGPARVRRAVQSALSRWQEELGTARNAGRPGDPRDRVCVPPPLPPDSFIGLASQNRPGMRLSRAAFVIYPLCVRKGTTRHRARPAPYWPSSAAWSQLIRTRRAPSVAVWHSAGGEWVGEWGGRVVRNSRRQQMARPRAEVSSSGHAKAQTEMGCRAPISKQRFRHVQVYVNSMAFSPPRSK